MANDASVIGTPRSAPNPIFPWNPFQDQVDCRINDEILHITTGTNGKTQFMPRNAPFFVKNLVIRPYNGGNPLELGRDYIFANPFNEFIKKYPRNVFGSIIFLNMKVDTDVKISYDTVGFPFALDDAAYAEAIANMYSSPRTAQWSDLINVSAAFPPPPHEEDINESYDYREMMDYMYQMVNSLGTMVHQAVQAIDVGGVAPATVMLAAEPGTNTGADYQVVSPNEIGDAPSANKLVTVNAAMVLLRKISSGEIKLN